MDAKLVVVGGEAKPAEIKLRLPVIIGRGRQATLILPHPLVSRQHCEIGESNGYLLVRDLGSLNGTFVNQRRVEQAILPPGGLLTLGVVSFRAVYSIVTGSDQPVSGFFDSRSWQETAGRTSSRPECEDVPEPAEHIPHGFWDSESTDPAPPEPASEAAEFSNAGDAPNQNNAPS